MNTTIGRPLIKLRCTVRVFHHLSLSTAHWKLSSAWRVVTLFDIVELICNWFLISIKIHLCVILLHRSLINVVHFDINGVFSMGSFRILTVRDRAPLFELCHESVHVSGIEIYFFANLFFSWLCLFWLILVSLNTRLLFHQFLLNVRIIRHKLNLSLFLLFLSFDLSWLQLLVDHHLALVSLVEVDIV